MRASSILVLLLLASPAAADTHLRLGVSGQLGNAEDDAPGNAGGASLRVLWDTSAKVRFGAMVEALWYDEGDSLQLDTTEQDVVALASFRISPAVSIDVGAGVVRYTGRVDIPEMPGCFGCGAYGDTTYAPALEAGLSFSAPITDVFSFELSARGRKAFALGSKTDVHNFKPPGASLRVDAGLGVSF